MQIETNVQNGTAQSQSVTLKAKYNFTSDHHLSFENKKEKEARRAIVWGGGGVIDFSKAEVNENNVLVRTFQVVCYSTCF